MNCPVCDDIKLREVQKEGVLIDVCPNCKGVWLDRGELDKLMQGVREIRDEFNEWYGNQTPNPPAQQQQPYNQQPNIQQQYNQQQYNQQPYNQQQYGQQPYYNDKYKYKQGYPHGKYKKKKTVMDLFGDLFD